MTFFGQNLFSQEQWERRGANDGQVRSLGTRLTTAEAALVPLVRAPIFITNVTIQSGTGNTTSTTFVDYPGPADATIIKQRAASVLVVQGAVGLYASVTNPAIWAVRINSVDTEIALFYFNSINIHTQVYGNQFVASGLAAGSYIMRVRWRSPGGTQINTDGNDRVLYTVTEWPT